MRDHDQETKQSRPDPASTRSTESSQRERSQHHRHDVGTEGDPDNPMICRGID